jgi:Holliday junction resolvase RusA-like endonuclease
MPKEDKVISRVYTIPGRPIPLARPRITRNGAYDIQKIEKEAVALQLKIQHGSAPKWTGPIHMDIHFCMHNAGSKKQQLKKEFLNHAKRPDLSNLIKFIEDAAQGILWDDDCIISVITARKLYTKAEGNPFTVFYITPYDRPYEFENK